MNFFMYYKIAIKGVLFIVITIYISSINSKASNINSRCDLEQIGGILLQDVDRLSKFPTDKGCDFYLWAWNSFLWLVEPSLRTNGEPRFKQLPSLKNVSIVDPDARKYEDNSIQALDFIQAGSRQVLVRDHKSNLINKSPVFYSSNVNSNTFDFVNENKLLNSDEYLKFPGSSGFPTGSMLFKYAWTVVDETFSDDAYYTTEAYVRNFKTTPDGVVRIIHGSAQKRVVALVGLHIVGFVDGHPSAVWATFEHKNNAPPATEIPSHSNRLVSDGDWLFYNSGTTMDQILTELDDYSQQKVSNRWTDAEVKNVARINPWGGAEIENINIVREMNNHVRINVFGPESVWKNYFLVGAVWGPPFILEPGIPIENTFGSPMLSNSTIETFNQDLGCFVCHNTLEKRVNGVSYPPKIINLIPSLLGQIRENTSANLEVTK